MNGESATAGTFFVLSRFVLRWPGEEYVGTEGHSSIRVLYAARHQLYVPWTRIWSTRTEDWWIDRIFSNRITLFTYWPLPHWRNLSTADVDSFSVRVVPTSSYSPRTLQFRVLRSSSAGRKSDRWDGAQVTGGLPGSLLHLSFFFSSLLCICCKASSRVRPTHRPPSPFKSNLNMEIRQQENIKVGGGELEVDKKPLSSLYFLKSINILTAHEKHLYE